MSIAGLVFQLAYRLRRHFCMGWPLARWLGFLIAIAGVWALIRFWPWLGPALGLAGLLVVHSLILGWATHCGFVSFRATPQDRALGAWSLTTPLKVDELVPVRASGWFTVAAKNQHYVSVEADYETVGTGEHIILGRIRPSRFLLVGQWPQHELGWRYIFVEPAMIRGMSVGRLAFGLHPSLALRLVYSVDGRHRQTAYLAFEEASDLQRVWADLLQDAPSGADLSTHRPAPQA